MLLLLMCLTEQFFWSLPGLARHPKSKRRRIVEQDFCRLGALPVTKPTAASPD